MEKLVFKYSLTSGLVHLYYLDVQPFIRLCVLNLVATQVFLFCFFYTLFIRNKAKLSS